MKFVFLKLIKFYQKVISPLLGKNCCFHPSCSHYTYATIEKYGVISGGWRGFKRILRCHPWSKGGIDLP